MDGIDTTLTLTGGPTRFVLRDAQITYDLSGGKPLKPTEE